MTPDVGAGSKVCHVSIDRELKWKWKCNGN